MVINVTKKMRNHLAVGLMMTVGIALFSMNTTVGAQPLPPQEPEMHDGGPERPMNSCHEMKGPSKEEQEQILKLLRIDEKTFRDYVKEGKSLAEIAKKQKVEIDRVVELIEAQLKEHARDRAEEIVNQKPMMPPHPRPER
jgi:hypothetical protein